jgi:hypothetical protein
MSGELGVARVLWSALFASTLLYVAMLELVDVAPSDEWQTLVPMFALGAVGAAGASIVVSRFLKPGTSYFVLMILALVLAESVAILGLVLGFLGAPPTVVMPFFFVAWVLMVPRFPTQAKLDAFRK